MRNYAEDLITKVKDTSQWPSIDIVHLTRLQQIATEARTTNSIEGSLAAILILHQLAEELLRLLLEQANFYTQLKLYPYPFKPKNGNKLTFGARADLLKHSVGFQNKKYILEDAMQLNNIRIQIAHGLTQPKTIDRLNENTGKAFSLYSSMQWLSLEAFTGFNDHFIDHHRDVSWPPEITRYSDSYTYEG